MSSNANTFFVLTTMAIGVPTGIKIFNWLATMWGGRIHFKMPMLFCLGFLFQFLIAGLTGIMLSAAPFDWQLGNSYFVVAHFHYVIVGGILFALFGAFYYWFPKMSGRMLQRNPGEAALRAVSHRLPPDVRLHAHPGTAGHAATNLYLRTGPRLGHLESASSRSAWSFRRAAILVFVGEPGVVLLQGQACRERSMGRLDAGMVHQFTAACLQLRGDSCREKPPTALGPQAPGRSGLEIRSSGARVMNASPMTMTASGTAVGASDARSRRHVLPHCRRDVDLRHLRRRVHLLHRQEPDGTHAQGGSRGSDLLHDLPAVEQPHHSLRRQGASAGGHADVSAAGGSATIALGATFLYGTAREWHG